MFCRNTKNKDMESAGRKIRMGSVQMCDLDSHRSVPRTEGGVPLAPCEPAVPAASHVLGHIQEYTEMPVVVMKLEHDAKEATTTQEASAEYICLPESVGADFSRIIKEEDDFIMKTEEEADEMMVKQELDIGSMVLQPQAGPRLLSLSTQEDDFIMKTEDEAGEMMVKQELEIGPTVLQPQVAPLMTSPPTQVWTDKKYLAKKAAAARTSALSTGGGPSTAPPLPRWESKVISIMGDGFGEPQTTARVPAFIELSQEPSASEPTAASLSTNQEDPIIYGPLEVMQAPEEQPDIVQPGPSQEGPVPRSSAGRQRRQRGQSTLAADRSVRNRLFQLEEQRVERERQRNEELAGIKMAVLELCSLMRQSIEQMRGRNNI